MQFMVLSRRRTETFTDADFERILPAETAHARGLYMNGVVRQIWLRGDTAGACFIIEAADTAQANAMVAELPMAAAGVSEFTVIPLSPYRGFGAA
ncbi:muconolactone Delta-isomerase family protein [Nocardia sp. NRRL WC-3656]|uniref:muconolactone Delta-isomerase family protein n=1 Tax=Nocardia sp. NRRL WC-3656 TaxID=1463824 RepID=UPI0004C2E9A5|nr:muconolactone Delta-isomerase family protein [Nocardia sp. NRRL WC-3656]